MKTRNKQIKDAISKHTEKLLAAGPEACKLAIRKAMLNHWNYRWIWHKHEDEEWLALYEVYYATEDDSEPISWTENPTTIVADNHAEIFQFVEMMHKAAAKPVLMEVKGPDGKTYLHEKYSSVPNHKR